MSLRIILIAAAALICVCQADVSEINVPTAEELLVPFNDLLPPLLDESTTTTTTTTATEAEVIASSTTSTIKPKRTTTTATVVVVAAAPLDKPTKKSYYQQQMQHIKELHLMDEDVLKPKDFSAQMEHLQRLRDEPSSKSSPVSQSKIKVPMLSLDLLPPLEELPVPEKDEEKVATDKQKKPMPMLVLDLLPPFEAATEPAEEPTTTTKQPKTTAKKQKIQLLVHELKQPAISDRQPAASTSRQHQHTAKPAHSPLAAKLPSAAQPQQLRLSSFAASPSTPSTLSADLIQQYASYFQLNTPRPPRGPLPTLTPFPRHTK